VIEREQSERYRSTESTGTKYSRAPLHHIHSQGKKEEDIAKASELFVDCYKQIESKQLKPFVRTQYMRSAFQMGHDRTVSFTLDTNLVMLKENPEGNPSCAMMGRWYRDPSLPIHPTEITRFPHAVLEIKLALPDGQLPPAWVTELMESGGWIERVRAGLGAACPAGALCLLVVLSIPFALCCRQPMYNHKRCTDLVCPPRTADLITEVHKSSKFIHGTAVLFPELVQAVPYWIDDESLRDSILGAAPQPNAVATT
jgi:SPX domain protein involved in polyphosphate accumulation